MIVASPLMLAGAADLAILITSASDILCPEASWCIADANGTNIKQLKIVNIVFFIFYPLKKLIRY